LRAEAEVAQITAVIGGFYEAKNTVLSGDFAGI
jgi:hypothetical protein